MREAAKNLQNSTPNHLKAFCNLSTVMRPLTSAHSATCNSSNLSDVHALKISFTAQDAAFNCFLYLAKGLFLALLIFNVFQIRGNSQQLN